MGAQPTKSSKIASRRKGSFMFIKYSFFA